MPGGRCGPVPARRMRAAHGDGVILARTASRTLSIRTPKDGRTTAALASRRCLPSVPGGKRAWQLPQQFRAALDESSGRVPWGMFCY